MKTKLSLILAVAATLGLPALQAQEDRPPQPPAPPQDGQSPKPRQDDERGPRPRPDGDRGKDGPNDGRPGRPDGDRHPGGPEGGRRGDDERGFGPRGDGGRHQDGPRERGAERPPKPTPYIGVISSPVPLPLGSQLGLAEGFGLLVEEVVPESPAATAGVQRFDVLKLIDDQQLIDPNQLAVLVRSYGKDREASLTVLRKGQEQKLTLKIGERLLPDRHASMQPSPGEMFSRMDAMRERMGENGRRFQDDARGFQDRDRDFQKRADGWHRNPGDGPAPEPPKGSSPGPGGPGNPPAPADAPPPPAPPRPGDLLHEVRPGGAPQVRVDQDGAVTTWNTAQARFVVKDETGEVEVSSENGHRTVLAKNPAGETIFTGPVDTEEQRSALPPPVRRVLDHIQKQRFGQEARGMAGGEPDAAGKRPPVASGGSTERDIQ